MRQLSKTKSIFYHLYPGIIIVLCFIFLTPALLKYNCPPQMGILASIIVAALPLLIIHLRSVKKNEGSKSLTELNGFGNKLPGKKLILYVGGLVIFAFLIWGITEPVNKLITTKLLNWLPGWFTIQDFNGYDKGVIVLTLILNLVINGLIAPVVEEYYFRGYLLSRMETWGKRAFVLNAILFSLYHFWQPYIWLTLIVSLLPMTYLVWKTKDLRVGIYTHCLLNIIGALLSFGLLAK
jgi:membrane protease YdiL (CAAX protease family)